MAGAQVVVDIGDARRDTEFDLEGAINERTAAVVSFTMRPPLYARWPCLGGRDPDCP